MSSTTAPNSSTSTYNPTDSVLMYLNTWDFDESLIFSGKGGSKNNFLINLYLQQEKNEKNFKQKLQIERRRSSLT